MDTTAAKSTEELDAELVSTLREIDPHNYAYLFARCKTFNVNARQLRYLRQDHIRELIPKSELGILVEFEHSLNLWQISKGYTSLNTNIQLNQANESENLISPEYKPQAQSNIIIAKEKAHILSNNQPVVVAKQAIDIKPLPQNLQGHQFSSLAMVVAEPDVLLTVLDSDESSTISTAKRMKYNADDQDRFMLEKIIPKLLMKLKDSYKSKNSLSTNERRLLCSSIVDYFESRKMKFTSDAMEDLAEQVVEHFPKEDKKSWCNRDGNGTSGRLVHRLRNSRRNTGKQTNNTSTSKVGTNSTSREPESRVDVHDEESKSLQAWLKFHKCENFSEIIDLWEDTMKYRCWQTQKLKDLKSIREFLYDWPSYKLESGHELLTMDFKNVYPQAMETFRTRWLVYKQNIEAFLNAELKDFNYLKLLKKYQLNKATTNDDSSSCVLIYLVHAITTPLRHFKTVNDNVTNAITDSQHSMTRLIQHKAEIDEYAEPYPCIFVVGDSMLEVEECYVVFMDLHYKLSYEDCLAVCVQMFMVLKVEDHPASHCFWKFIRGYMFNIAKDKLKFNGATENMVTYLETAASSI